MLSAKYLQVGHLDFTPSWLYQYFKFQRPRSLNSSWIHSTSHYSFKDFVLLYKSFCFVEKWKDKNKQKGENYFHPSIQHRVLGIEAINKYLLIECQELAPWPLSKLLKLSYSICKKGWLPGLCATYFLVMDLCDMSDLSGTWWKVLNKSYFYYYLQRRNDLRFCCP